MLFAESPHPVKRFRDTASERKGVRVLTRNADRLPQAHIRLGALNVGDMGGVKEGGGYELHGENRRPHMSVSE